jgi:LacI family transcriptional regulator
MSKLTIKEIAKIAGVSPSAVSIVINNKKGVSESTRKKVSEIIEKLQYAPNPNSRRLLLKKTNNIAILFEKDLSPMEHLFYSELNRVILHECETLGYNLIFTSITVEEGNVVLPNVIKAYDVDGIILYGDVDKVVLNGLKKFDIPYIVVDNHLADPDTLSISADYEKAAYTATRHLISLGHKDIAYLGNSSLPNFNLQTFSGFKRALEECRIILPISWIQMSASSEDSAYDCMEAILAYDQFPSAVFCSADIYAIGAMRSIKSHGLKIPSDISIVAIDDIILSRYVDPPLTTVRIDKVEMGKMAMGMLVKKMEKKYAESRTVKSDQLIIRGSTGSFMGKE